MDKILLIIMISLVCILVSIYSLLPSCVADKDMIIFSESVSKSKVNCKNVKQPCQTNTDCSESCSEQELICVNTPSYGNVCLPSIPDTSCDTTKGGLPIWTGYGFSETQGWNCMCQFPEYFVGPHCSTPNPYYCTGGTVDPTNLSDTGCTCPSGTTKMYRANSNVPFCGDNTPNATMKYGLSGDMMIHPSWNNIYVGSNDINEWASDIYNELYNSSNQKASILPKIKEIIGTSKTLSSDIATKLCSILPTPNNLCPSSFKDGEVSEALYTYYDNSYRL